MKFTPHPILKAPTPEEIKKLCFNEDGSDRDGGLEALIKLHEMHEDAVSNADADPLNFGVSLKGWVYADAMLDLYDTLIIFGGNRSSKTEYGARSVVKAALDNPNSIIVCFAQDADASVRTQQSAVYRYLPPEFKQKTKGVLEYLNYTVKNGFTGQSFILPNGSQVLFHTYSQFIANRSKF